MMIQSQQINTPEPSEKIISTQFSPPTCFCTTLASDGIVITFFSFTTGETGVVFTTGNGLAILVAAIVAMLNKDAIAIKMILFIIFVFRCCEIITDLTQGKSKVVIIQKGVNRMQKGVNKI